MPQRVRKYKVFYIIVLGFKTFYQKNGINCLFHYTHIEIILEVIQLTKKHN